MEQKALVRETERMSAHRRVNMSALLNSDK